MIENFYCPCCGEERKLRDDADLLFAGMEIECPECGTIFAVCFTILQEADLAEEL